MNKNIEERLLAATQKILEEQKNSEYADKVQRIKDEVSARSSEYLGILESAQAKSISKLKYRVYIG